MDALIGRMCFLTLPFIMRPGSFGEWSFNDTKNLSDLFVYCSSLFLRELLFVGTLGLKKAWR